MAKVGEGRLGRRPSYSTQRLIQGKWAILIMHHLEGGPMRFSELVRRMPEATHVTLSRQLRQLIDEGLVRRTTMDDDPSVAEYSLTDVGLRFGPVLDSVRGFSEEYTSMLIMHYLADGPLRFSELARRMPKMTHAALSNQLKGLTGEGLVRRTVMDGTRPGARPVAEYSLTEMGVRFSPVLDSIRSLCQEYIEYLGSR